MRYTKTHEWARRDGNVITVGITDYAQEQLSDLTYVELPAPGDEVAAQEEVAVVESVKAASDIYSPVSGRITEVNTALADNPEQVNTDPFGAGWLFKIEPSDWADFDALLDADEYEALLPEDEE